MAQQAASSSGATLFQNLEAPILPLDESALWYEAVRIERELVNSIQKSLSEEDTSVNNGDIKSLSENSFLPTELISTSIKKNSIAKPKADPLKKIKELASDNVEDEEEQDDEEDEDEEQVVEDEEDDAGGDYLVSHFDNGEGFDENEDEGDDMNGGRQEL